MPAGITHMLLAKTFNENDPEGNEGMKDLLDDKLKFFQLGALAPDLAYSQQTPLEDLFSDEDEFSDLFHYKLTNQIPLQALAKIKDMKKSNEKDELFAFFLGYSSHVIADGIIHPYVRDKVGNYEDAKGKHRALEMRLDAIFLYELSSKNGDWIDLNFAELQDQIADLNDDQLSHITIFFADIINEVYDVKIPANEIADWVNDLHNLFEIAANKNNCWYAAIPGMSSFFYNDTEKVIKNKEKDVILKNGDAVDREKNFLNRDVTFAKCVERFYIKFGELANIAYLWIYENGEPLTGSHLKAINLDTGRALSIADGKDLDQPAVYWS